MMIGVVGGMGPEASNTFCSKLISMKKCSKDQENIPFFHYCNPKIPDRTKFILGEGQNPIPELLHSCNIVENAGANFLVLPCNTAHYFLPELKKSINTPIIDMVSLTIKKIKQDMPSVQKVGVLSTTGTIQAKVYEEKLNQLGIETIKPDSFYQESFVMEAIYGTKGIKSGKKKLGRTLLTNAVEHLISNGAQAIILGCTEIPLVLKQKDFIIPFYEPMEITVSKIIEYNDSLNNEIEYSSELINKSIEVENILESGVNGK